MLQVTLIGNVGADAIRKAGDGYEFVSFRVCHNDRYTDSAGVRHESTMWVDCVMDKDAKVAEYLKAGTQVYVTGSLSLRVYSSAKDRCMKAGATIRVQRLELLSGKSDPVPGRLIDNDGVVHEVQKYFHCDVPGCFLHNERGAQFASDDNGWVVPIENAPQDIQIKAMQEQAAREQSQQQATTQPPASSAPVAPASPGQTKS